MDSPCHLEAADLLALPEQQVRAWFQGSETEARLLYRRLLKQWHPDRNPHPKAQDVFIRLRGLYPGAKRAAGRRKPDSALDFRARDGRAFRFQFKRAFDFELGTTYQSLGSVAYLVRPEHHLFVERYTRALSGLRFVNDAMANQILPMLPRIHADHQGDGGTLLVVRKRPEALLLRDVLNYYKAQGTSFPAQHAGWILNCLFNLACYLEHSGISHQSISADTVWLDPSAHAIQLLGGWFYSAPFGQRVRKLPSLSASCAARAWKENPIADGRLDLELIHALGRELLGDRMGQRMDSSAPEPLRHLLRLPANKTALTHYRDWKQALHLSFGPPKFVAMEISHHQLYAGE